MLFSLIIPVYAVEEYIAKCIESCCNQKNIESAEYEIILVDDSSPDKSIDIARSVFKKCNKTNFKVVSRPNGGLSAARNTGLNHANGDYIWFIDSDDYIEDNSLYSLKEIITSNPDLEIVSFGHRSIYSSFKQDHVFCPNLINKTTTGFEVIQSTAFYSAWGRIYKSSFLKKSDVKFVENIIWEDGEFNLRLLSITRKHYSSSLILYNYLRRPRSISTSNLIKKTLDSDIIKFVKLYSWRKSHQFDLSQQKIFNYRNNESLIFLLAGIPKLPTNEQKPYYAQIKQLRNELKESFKNSNSDTQKLLLPLIIYSPRFLAKILCFRMKSILKKEQQNLNK